MAQKNRDHTRTGEANHSKSITGSRTPRGIQVDLETPKNNDIKMADITSEIAPDLQQAKSDILERSSPY